MTLGDRDGPAPPSELVGRVARVQGLIDDEPFEAEHPAGMVGRLHQLCLALVRALPSDGAGLSVMAEGQVGGGGGTVAASSLTSRRLEEIQFSLAEGPCFDAFTLRHPVLESDLGGHGMRRWLGYGPAAHEEGVRAVFAFPLQVGAARLGALDIYRAKPGPLSPRAVSQAATFAEVAMTTLLDGQQAAPDGEVAPGLDDVLQGRAEIYQAQGMVQVHLGVSLIEAMARLRAHAYVHNQVLADLARDVVAGRTVLTRDAS